MSEEREMTPMEEAVRHTAEKIEAEEIAEIEADRAHVDLGCDCETCDPEAHAAEHPEDHINGSYTAELEECCGGHCGCHEPKSPIVEGFKGAMEMVRQQAEPPFRLLTPEEIVERDAKIAAEREKPQVITLPTKDHDWCKPDCGQHETMMVSNPMTEEERAAMTERIAQIKGEIDHKMNDANEGDVHGPTMGVVYDQKGRRQTTPLHKVESSLNIGRNDPCPCGSGKKFKKCCIDLINNE